MGSVESTHNFLALYNPKSNQKLFDRLFDWCMYKAREIPFSQFEGSLDDQVLLHRDAALDIPEEIWDFEVFQTTKLKKYQNGKCFRGNMKNFIWPSIFLTYSLITRSESERHGNYDIIDLDFVWKSNYTGSLRNFKIPHIRKGFILAYCKKLHCILLLEIVNSYVMYMSVIDLNLNKMNRTVDNAGWEDFGLKIEPML